MSKKRTIKLEFEYVSKYYTQESNGVECYDSYIKPVGDHDFWAHILKDPEEFGVIMGSVADSTEHAAMSLIAMTMKDAATYTAGERGLSVEFSEKATFIKGDGTKVIVKPAVFTPH